MSNANDYFTGGTTGARMNLNLAVDVSTSTEKEIEKERESVKAAIKHFEDTCVDKDVRPFTRVLLYSDDACYIIGDVTKGEEHVDVDVLPMFESKGCTNTPAAVRLMTEACVNDHTGVRDYPSINILISDGQHNIGNMDQAVKELKEAVKSKSDSGKDKAINIAIGVNGSNGTRWNELEDFASRGTILKDNDEKEEDVPLAFFVENFTYLKRILINVIENGVVSSIKANKGFDEDDVPVIKMVEEIDEDDEDPFWDEEPAA